MWKCKTGRFLVEWEASGLPRDEALYLAFWDWEGYSYISFFLELFYIGRIMCKMICDLTMIL